MDVSALAWCQADWFIDFLIDAACMEYSLRKDDKVSKGGAFCGTKEPGIGGKVHDRLFAHEVDAVKAIAGRLNSKQVCGKWRNVYKNF